MKFSLFDFQEEALEEVFQHLAKAKNDWKAGYTSSFALTATTGAGKTVMVAAIFEGLFNGNDKYKFDSDTGATVIWFSDDPSLNEQSRVKLLQASDKLNIGNLVTVSEDSFDQEKLEPKTVYFLNTQKLSRTSRLVRGDTDNRTYTIWETIQNTINDDSTTLYLLLDEAHRGMGENGGGNGANRTTIVKQLINGFEKSPPIPIVVGISATVERFTQAMQDAQNRATQPNVKVPPGRVQSSGLLKDTIALDIPKVSGPFDTVLVRRGAEELNQISKAWAEYCKAEDCDRVSPLLILQVPNKPDPTKIGECIDIIFSIVPNLSVENVAHVFGEHTSQKFGSYTVNYIKPERVQETDEIRILIAKDAISTGWDCPRAEVMVSFRSAVDQTYITQLLGRMLRTPLARRIEGNEELNSVTCLLPGFDDETTERVVESITKGDEGQETIPGRRVLLNSQTFYPNPSVKDNVWEQFEELESWSLPRRGFNPLQRLQKLALALSNDDIVKKCVKKVNDKLHKLLDGLYAQYKDEIHEVCDQIRNVEIEKINVNKATGESTTSLYTVPADYNVIEQAFKQARRLLSPSLSNSYCGYLASKGGDDEDSIIDAQIVISGMARLDSIVSAINEEAARIAKELLNKYRAEIKSKSEARRSYYTILSEQDTEPVKHYLVKPESWIRETSIRQDNGKVEALPTFEQHMISDNDGKFPVELNPLETHVVHAELQRRNMLAWYRNPGRKCEESLGILYEKDSEASILRPDFLFFSENSDGSISASIVDPHSTIYADALPKIKGLAEFAEKYGKLFDRIEAVDEINSGFKYLDLQNPKVRAAAQKAESATNLYESDFANDYT